MCCYDGVCERVVSSKIRVEGNGTVCLKTVPVPKGTLASVLNHADHDATLPPLEHTAPTTP